LIKELAILGKVFHLLKGINIHPAYLLIPITLSLAAAVFEGVGMSLLIPLLNGFLSKDFSFITQTPYLSDVLAMLPSWIAERDRTLFLFLLIVFVCVIVSKNTLKYLGNISMAFLAERSLHHLRKVVFGRYLSFGKLYFDRTSVGHHSIVLSEFTQVALRPILAINKHVNALFSLIVYLVVMSFISWQLTLFALPLFGIIHFAVRTMLERIRTLSKKIAERGGELGKKSVEILSTIPLIKSYSTQGLEQRRYAQVSDEKAKMDFHVTALQNLILPLQETITLFLAVALFAVMLLLLVQGDAESAPSFIVYFYLVLNASSKFGTLTGFRGYLAHASGPIDEVASVFDNSDKDFIPEGDKDCPGLQNVISFRDLSFVFPGRGEVLKKLSFTIKKGSMTAIVGPTGAGKSTIINLIMRFYDCPPNSLYMDDTDIREYRLDSLLTHIALVSQDTLLLHDTLRNNIAYGLDDMSDAQIQEVVERARLTALLTKLPDGLDTVIGDRGVKLSGGEKQRVSIARALLKGSEILILDEATSSLDSQTEKLIQEAIDEAVKDRTAIVIAHRLSTIQHADDIIVLDEGERKEQGTLKDLLDRKGKFYELWEEQKFV
jgi:ATP-binding cassette, subfamily B, bacterial MsbA